MNRTANSFKTLHLSALLIVCLIWAGCKKNDSTDYPKTGSATETAADTKAHLSSRILQTVNTTITSAPVTLVNVTNKVIQLLNITGNAAVCIRLINCSNITIQNCMLHNSSHEGITLTNCANVTITNCFFTVLSSGVYAYKSTGINVTGNQFLNMMGPYPRGSFVQFENVSGAGNKIANNKCENVAGQSAPEDEISMYKCTGTADSPIQITGNWLRGGGDAAGIQLGDGGGSFQLVQNNILVNPGSVGIAISSGHSMQVLSNTIFSIKQSISNVGIDIWNEYSSDCNFNTVTGNKVKWTNSDNDENDYWNGENCGAVIGLNNNTWNAKIDATILPITFIINLLH